MKLDFIKKGPILFIGCHPDDIELGCGGLLNKIKNQYTIFTLTLSKNQVNSSNKNLIKEQKKSLDSLGIKNSKNIVADFTTRGMFKERQEICDYLWTIKKKINPTCVFVTPNDLHQDHQVCNIEAQRVFRDCTILEYFISRSTFFDKPRIFVELSKTNIDAKIKALKNYKTYKNKNYFYEDSIWTSSKFFGSKSELEYCEVFNPISMIIK